MGFDYPRHLTHPARLRVLGSRRLMCATANSKRRQQSPAGLSHTSSSQAAQKRPSGTMAVVWFQGGGLATQRLRVMAGPSASLRNLNPCRRRWCRDHDRRSRLCLCTN